MGTYVTKVWQALFLGLAAGLACSAYAAPVETDAQPETGGTLEEIIVTAQKRTENIQNVPISMAVLSAETLQRSGISGTDELGFAVPGLILTNISGGAQPYIRGVGTTSTSNFGESAIVAYVDGVYMPSLGQFFQELADIDRVEVLKGPQGVLYGRNSTGGAINIITRDPDAETRITAELTSGNEGQQDFNGSLSGGTDQLAASISLFSAQHDGFVKNLAPNNPDLNDQDTNGVRAKVKYKPNDAWSFVLAGDYVKTDDHNGFGFTNLPGTRPVGATADQFSVNPYTTYLNYPSFENNTNTGVSLTAKGSFDSMDFVSISSLRRFHKDYALDLDGSDLDLLGTHAIYASKTYTQEFQLLSNDTSRFQWIVGTYFLHLAEEEPITVGTTTAPLENIYGADSTTSYSAYGQGTYALTDHWKLTAGVRYSQDQKTLDALSLTSGTGAPLITTPSQDVTYRNTSPKFGVEYHQQDLLLYASATKGYRAGIYNLASPGDAGPVNPEKITAYEIGGKHDLLNETLRVDWSAFSYKYTNLQVEVLDPRTGITVFENAASTKSRGADVDITWVLGQRFTASLGMAYLDAKYINFPNASIQINNPAGGTIAGVANASGDTVNSAPKFTASPELVYSLPLPWSTWRTARFVAAYAYDSGYYFNAENSIKQNAYGIVNLRVQFLSRDDHWNVALFVKNLTNETYLTGVVATSLATLAQYDAPRLYGVTVGFRY